MISVSVGKISAIQQKEGERDMNFIICENQSFAWSSNILIQNLMNKIERGQYKVFPLDLFNSVRTEDWEVYCACIDNFMELGKKLDVYKGSFGSDGNPVTSWKIQTQDGNWFFVIGKYNPVTSKEDIAIFYNDAPIFEVVKCHFMISGPVDDEPFYSFWNLCRGYIYPVNEE